MLHIPQRYSLSLSPSLSLSLALASLLRGKVHRSWTRAQAPPSPEVGAFPPTLGLAGGVCLVRTQPSLYFSPHPGLIPALTRAQSSVPRQAHSPCRNNGWVEWFPRLFKVFGSAARPNYAWLTEDCKTELNQQCPTKSTLTMPQNFPPSADCSSVLDLLADSLRFLAMCACAWRTCQLRLGTRFTCALSFLVSCYRRASPRWLPVGLSGPLRGCARPRASRWWLPRGLLGLLHQPPATPPLSDGVLSGPHGLWLSWAPYSAWSSCSVLSPQCGGVSTETLSSFF